LITTLGTNNAPCSQALPRRYAVEYREQCLELSKTEQDIAVLGQLAALRRQEPTIAVVSAQKKEPGVPKTIHSFSIWRHGCMQNHILVSTKASQKSMSSH